MSYQSINSFEYAKRNLVAFEKTFCGLNFTNKFVTMKTNNE